ncbi:MAG: hypothetical protein ABIT04_02475 [Novosphingobium sp.]
MTQDETAATSGTKQPRYLLICNTADGLIAQVNGVIVQLQLARRLGLVPIVQLHQRSNMFGAENPYFEQTRGANVWEYYFEPIGVAEDELTRLVQSGQVLTLANASELLRLFRWETGSWFMNAYGYFRSVQNCADGPYPQDWWLGQRRKVRAFIADGTMRVTKAIVDQADTFAARNFSGKTLGLQLRGSDKFDFGVGPNLSRKVTPEEYFPHIDRYLAENPDCTRIFVATDQRQWLKLLEQAYPGKILSFSEWSLSDSEGNSFNAAHEKGARGAEVLVDALLLARCSYLIKCHAGVGEMALVLNPDLDFLDLNYAEQPYRARKSRAHPLLAATIKATCAVWRAAAERGFALARVESFENGEVVVKGGGALNVKPSAKIKAARPPVLSRRFLSDGTAWALRALDGKCFAYEASGVADRL